MVGETTIDARRADRYLDWVVSWRSKVSSAGAKTGSVVLTVGPFLFSGGGSSDDADLVWSVTNRGGALTAALGVTSSTLGGHLALTQAGGVANGAWEVHRVRFQFQPDGAYVRRIVTWTVNGATVASSDTTGQVWYSYCRPTPTHQVSVTATGPSTSGGTEGLWYHILRSSIGTMDLDLTNVVSVANGALRFFDNCSDGFPEWLAPYGGACYHHPRLGAPQTAMSETTALQLRQTDMGLRGGGLAYGIYSVTASHSGRRRGYRTTHATSGCEMRYAVERIADHGMGNGLIGWWRRYEPFDGEDYDRSSPDWVEPTRLNHGAMGDAYTTLLDPDAYPLAAPVYRSAEDADWNVDTAFTKPSPPAAADDPPTANPSLTWPTRELVTASEQGKAIMLGYAPCDRTGVYQRRYRPAVVWQTSDDHYGRRAEVMHSDDATACLDPVSGELVMVGLQDRWSGETATAYVVSLVRQGVELTQEGPVVCGEPLVMVETMPATSGDHALMLADAIILPDGALWVAVWSAVPTSTGYAQLDLHLYRQADAGAACVEVEHLADVPRPPFNTLRLVHDQVSGELFAVWNDRTASSVGRTVRVLQLDHDAVTDHGSWAADDDLPTPSYGELLDPDAVGQPWYLLDVVIAPSGRWQFRWAWAAWFNPYATAPAAARSAAEDTSNVYADEWPISWQDANGDMIADLDRGTSLCRQWRLEDVQDFYPDPHLLTGHGVDTARDMLELVP